MSTPWLEGLNPAQQEAVTHGEGPLLVIAGAGTGKTKTLACRVAYLIAQGVWPDRILLLTFTRRAAAEMLSRAAQMTAQDVAGRVWGGTFHAVANRLLRQYGRALGLLPDYTVMDQGDAADLMNLIRNELGLGKTQGKRRFPRKETLVQIYSRTVNAEEKLSEILQKYFSWCVDDIEAIRLIFDAYSHRKREANVLDYDDLLLFWKALCEVPGVSDTLADRFDYVLVDEYQDTNAIQGDILVGMCKNTPNIMVVGDDAQSIYSFRSATIRNILDFPDQFPDTRVVTLEQNYRSTQPILSASNAVMDQAHDRYTKNLWSDRLSDQKPVLYTVMDEAEQCQAVCDQILAHLEQGTPLHQQAVLFRAGYHSDALEIELARRNIPFHKYGGLKFIESAHIKDMLAFLRILENPYDALSWYRVFLLMDGIGPRGAQRLMNELGVRREDLDIAAEEEPRETAQIVSPLKRLFSDPPKLSPAARGQFGQFRRTLADCCGVTLAQAKQTDEVSETVGGALPLASQIERIRKFYEPLFERKYENPKVRLRDIEQLEQIATGYRSRRQFVTDLTLDPPTATSDLAQAPFLEEDWLVLSTIHSAKGCEWEVVHIIHAADGMIPSDMALRDEAGVDEERRLFYVGMTRSKDRLYVYFPLRYYRRGWGVSDKHTYAKLTRFITKPVRALFEEKSATVDPERAFPRYSNNVQSVRDQLKQFWNE